MHSGCQVAYTKKLYQETYNSGVSEGEALDVETDLQKKILGSYNQMAGLSRFIYILVAVSYGLLDYISPSCLAQYPSRRTFKL